MSHGFDMLLQLLVKSSFSPGLLSGPQSLLPTVGHRHELRGEVRTGEPLVLVTSQTALLKIVKSRAHWIVCKSP